MVKIKHTMIKEGLLFTTQVLPKVFPCDASYRNLISYLIG